MGFYIKQIIKMIAQHVLFPIYYFICCRKPVTRGLVVFADEHKTACPPSMQRLHDALLLQEGLTVVDDFFDLQAMSAQAGMRRMLAFMKLYAQAEFVILQDNFLPVSSCHKRKGTTVIQLWHGCGAFKRFGYDAKDDIPQFYKGNVYKNYDLVTVSSPYCRPFFTSAMRMKHPKTVRAYGSSYTDCYFDEAYKAAMQEKFEQTYGAKNGRTVIVWAPTFRGNAGQQSKGERTIGEAWIDELAKNPDYLVIKSLHPHMLKRGESQPLTTGELLFSADLLITDYSSVLFEYLLLDRPLLFFALDLETYGTDRGWYLSYEDMPGAIVTEGEQLADAVAGTLGKDVYAEKRHAFREQYMSCCDGNATKRLVRYILHEETKRNDVEKLV